MTGGVIVEGNDIFEYDVFDGHVNDKRFSDAELAMVWRGIAEDERKKLRQSINWRGACEGVKM